MDRFGRSTGPGAVAAEHDEASLIAFAAQSLGRGKTRGTAADDYNSAGCLLRSAARFAGCRLAPFPHEDLALALFHGPAPQGTEGGRAQGLARTQIETGVVPGAAQAIAHHEPLGERPLVVGAVRADSENLRPSPQQKDRLVADMADELGTI